MWTFYHLAGKRQKQYSLWQSSAHGILNDINIHQHNGLFELVNGIHILLTSQNTDSVKEISFHRNILLIWAIRNLIQSYTSEQQRHRTSKGGNVSKKQKWGQEVDTEGKYSLEDHKSQFHIEALRSQQLQRPVEVLKKLDKYNGSHVGAIDLSGKCKNVKAEHACPAQHTVSVETKVSISRGLLKI